MRMLYERACEGADAHDRDIHRSFVIDPSTGTTQAARHSCGGENDHAVLADQTVNSIRKQIRSTIERANPYDAQRDTKSTQYVVFSHKRYTCRPVIAGNTY